MILMVYVLMISKSQLHAIVEYIAMILIIVLILGLTSPNIPSLSLEHLQRIFHQQYIYLVHLHTHTSSHHPLPPLCQTNTNLCLQLTTTDHAYQTIYTFLSYNQPSFYFIIDGYHQKKYVLEQLSSSGQLEQFYRKFQNGQLSPYYASQQAPSLVNNKCQQLVGSTYEQFLVQEEFIKLVYLYTKESFCQQCKEVLDKFKELAEKYHEEGLIVFGFFDVMSNDSRHIKDEIVPYLLIYHGNIEEAMGLDLEDWVQVEQIIKYLIGQRRVSRRKGQRGQVQQL